jgi:hypothetical protein
VQSKPIELAEISPPQVWVSAGRQTRLGVKIVAGGLPGEVPSVLQWFRNEQPLEVRPSKVGKNFFIVINDASSADAGRYHAKVQYRSLDDDGAEPVCSRATTVYVTGSDIQDEVARIIREKGEAALTDDTPTKVVHDFAGQRMYYVLHAILLAELLTRYVLAVSLEHELTDPLDDPEDAVFGMTHGENLEFWLNSIHSRAPRAPILLVCTKLDLVPDGIPEHGIAPITAAKKKARVQAIRDSLKGKPYQDQVDPQVLCVSSKTGEGIEDIRALLDNMEKVKDYGADVPLKWFKWHKITKEMVESESAASGGRRRISYADAVAMAKACDITTDDWDSGSRSAEVDAMLRKFNDVGFIMWHDRPGARELVVLEVQWMLDQMTALLCTRSLEQKYSLRDASLTTKWDDLRTLGRLHIDLLPELWPDLERPERQAVVHYMIGFGHCCLLHDSERSESEQVDRSTLLVPTLLPPCADGAASVWAGNADADRSLRVCFISVPHDDGSGDDWPESRRFLPDTLFFRLVAALVQDVKRSSDRFKDLYRDRVVIRTQEQRYMLSHDREHQLLDLTVYGGDGRSALPLVLAKLRSCLDQMVVDFGVQYRFEARCELRGELGWHPLEDLDGHPDGQLWLVQPAEPGPGPEPEPQPQPTDSSAAARFAVVPKGERQFDFFINHCQKSGQDQCGKLVLLLQAAGCSVWYDMQAQDLTAQGMEEGVRQSRNVIIFLSDDVMGRPFCNAEQRWAKLYSCNLIGVVEKDSRHSPADFGKEKERAPVDLKHLLDDVEFLDYRRRGYEEKGMVDEIIRRGGVARMEPEPEPEPEPPVLEGVAPFASVLKWLSASKLEAFHAALEEIGYGDDLDMLTEGDGDEVAEVLAAVEKLAVGDKKAKPKVKKFKRELAKLRGREEQFD